MEDLLAQHEGTPFMSLKDIGEGMSPYVLPQNIIPRQSSYHNLPISMSTHDDETSSDSTDNDDPIIVFGQNTGTDGPISLSQRQPSFVSLKDAILKGCDSMSDFEPMLESIAETPSEAEYDIPMSANVPHIDERPRPFRQRSRSFEKALNEEKKPRPSPFPPKIETTSIEESVEEEEEIEDQPVKTWLDRSFHSDSEHEIVQQHEEHSEEKDSRRTKRPPQYPTPTQTSAEPSEKAVPVFKLLDRTNDREIIFGLADQILRGVQPASLQMETVDKLSRTRRRM